MMTESDDKIWPQEQPSCHLPVQVSTAQQGESKNILYYINYAICQGDMYTVAKKVILSICCVVRC